MKDRNPTEEAAYVIAASIDDHPEDYKTVLQILQESFYPDEIETAEKAIRNVLDQDFYEVPDLVLAVLPFIDPDYAAGHHDILDWGLPTWSRINAAIARLRRRQRHKNTTEAQRDLEELLLSDTPKITGPTTGPNGR